MVTNYQRGRAFEYQIIKFLEKNGYYVIRSSGSHGVNDLAAFKNNEVRFIQAKDIKDIYAKNYVVRKVEQEFKDFIIQKREMGNNLINMKFQLFFKIKTDKIYLYELKDIGSFNLQLQEKGFYNLDVFKNDFENAIKDDVEGDINEV